MRLDGQAADQILDVGQGQPPQADLLGEPASQQVTAKGPKRMGSPDLLFPVGTHGQRRPAGEVQRQEAQEIDGRRAGPVQILEDQHQWTDPRQPIDHLQDRLKQPLSLSGRVKDSRRRDGRPQGPQLGKDRAEGRPRDILQRKVADVGQCATQDGGHDFVRARFGWRRCAIQHATTLALGLKRRFAHQA